MRRIANLLTNGPSPKEASKKNTESAYILPTAPVELATDGASDHEGTEAQESTAYALTYPPPPAPVELHGTSIAPVELPGSDVTVETDHQPLPQIKLSSQDPVQRADTPSSWGQEKGKGERLQADEWLSSTRTRKARKPENWNYF